MKLSAKFLRSQLAIFRPVVSECSIELSRKGQNTLGRLMSRPVKSTVSYEDIRLGDMDACMLTPNDQLSNGIILYLHGGGYVCGGLVYAKGFSSVLCSRIGIKVFAPAYALAPEAPFPKAVDDALLSYDHLISLGYSPSEIILAGESAGGGLCYSLCLRLKSLNRELPRGIIAISPWTDLTMSGGSYKANRKKDPSITLKRLKKFADCYIYGEDTDNGDEKYRSTPEDIARDIALKTKAEVSPIYADLTGMPPSVIFVGGDEIMLDDSTVFHAKLREYGCESQVYVSKRKWHGYLLYGLEEDKEDFNRIAKFIKSKIPARKLHWMTLDNAAKIYPAARRRNWTNVFRLSATLTEDVDKEVLQSALDITVRRFPSIAVRLKTGMFWYYIEEVPKAPDIMDEKPYPLSRMVFDDIRKCAMRVIVYKKRIAVEFFHALTDGNGGLVFLKTLLREYISLKYGETIPDGYGMLNVLDEPTPAELEDSFLKYAGKVKSPRADTTAFKITGTKEIDSYVTNTTFIFNSADIVAEAKKRKVTVTAFLSSVMIMAAMRLQEKEVKNPKRRKPLKVLIPVNLRKMLPSESLRNFVLYITPGIDPRYGEYTLDEICSHVQSQMQLQNTPKQMQAKIAKNVGDESLLIVKLMPLFIKNFVMKMVFNAVGEKKSCFALSNLGVCQLPPEMEKYVSRMGFVLGVQANAPYNTGLVTYKDKMYLNFIRNIKEPKLEKAFYDVLKELGIRPIVESNAR
ncbi:MAG: alpha/beta hydrolase fold domain-containing protein [Clostridia bacterium]|nr:alpha/beta hydrolase fold domain-containing protein [Clostridia bacterium]